MIAPDLSPQRYPSFFAGNEGKLPPLVSFERMDECRVSVSAELVAMLIQVRNDLAAGMLTMDTLDAICRRHGLEPGRW